MDKEIITEKNKAPSNGEMKVSLNQLEDYIAVCKKLRSSRFIQETKQIKWSVKHVDGKPLKTSIGNFDEDLLKSCLLDFRKIYVQKEKTNFFKVCNVIMRLSQNGEVKKNVTECRKLYKQLLGNNLDVSFSINGSEQKSKKIIDDWINGFYFHEDDEKKLTIRNLGIGEMMHKAIFLTTIVDLINFAICVSDNASVFLKENDTFDSKKD